MSWFLTTTHACERRDHNTKLGKLNLGGYGVVLRVSGALLTSADLSILVAVG